MKTTLEKDFTSNCRIYLEHNIAFDGYTYLLIYGHHINGAFISIPNWKIACEATDIPHNTRYNAEKMRSAGLDADVSQALAEYIDKWISNSMNTEN
mgnify:CR=1 FL=1